MVGGISLKKAIEIVGHERGTYPKQLAKALRRVGARVPRNRLVRFSGGPLPRRCVMKVWLEDTKERWSHWVLVWDGRVYDPSDRGQAYWLNRNPRVTSYLEIYPRRWTR
jgi:hypothetical protein